MLGNFPLTLEISIKFHIGSNGRNISKAIIVSVTEPVRLGFQDSIKFRNGFGRPKKSISLPTQRQLRPGISCFEIKTFSKFTY